MSSNKKTTLFHIAILIFTGLPLFAQNGNSIFQVQKPSIKQEVLQYSPVNVGRNWFYTQVENEGVLISNLENEKNIPISGFNLRTKVVTGLGLASDNGLVAISIGDKKSNVPAKLKDNTMWFARQDGRGFAARYFEFALNNDAWSCTTPFISRDGTKLYFSSDKPGGYGGFDLYVADYRGKEWSEPRNLGPLINTSGDEVYPYLVDNMMFFSSNGHGGMRMDILIADMGNDIGRQVMNPGSPINSAADDYAMTFDNLNRKGYFLSDRDGVTGKVYEVTNQKKLLILNIRSNDDRRPISGTKADLSRCRSNPVYANASGTIILPVSPGDNCFVNIEKIGYNSTVFKVNYDEIYGLKKSIDIFLSEEGAFYSGRAVDESGYPADNVEFAIIDQATGETQYNYTDQYGNFRAALEPLSFYMVRSRSFYYDVKETRISTLSTVPSSILGTITLRRNSLVKPGIGTETIQKTETLTPKMEAEKKTQGMSDPDKTLEQEKFADTEKTINQNPTVETKPNIAPVIIEKPIAPADHPKYAIQLAAVSKDNTDLTIYQSKTRGLGQVYYVEEGNYNKIRLGLFYTEEDAKAMHKKLPADLKNGFIVLEKNRVLNDAGQMTPPVKKVVIHPEQTVTPTAPVSSNAGPVLNENVRKEYKIRLSTLRDPKLFNGSAIRDFGLIEEVRSGNLVVFYLSGFESMEEAKSTLPKVIDAGFSTAHLVQLINGEYTRID